LGLLQEGYSEETIDNFSGEYRWLSNFELSDNVNDYFIMLDGDKYRSVEHAYQAAKTLNILERWHIRAAITSGKAKRLGMTVTLRKNWDNIKLQVMYDCLIQKFSYPYFKELLIATHPKILIEGNTWGDTFYGVCNGIGQNNLGKLLMSIRENIINESRSGLDV